MKKLILFALVIFSIPTMGQGVADGSIVITQGNDNQALLQEDFCDIPQDDETEEYEQYVCDSIIVPKASSMTIFLREVGCSMLVRFIVLKEKLDTHLLALKNYIYHMLSARL